MFERRANMVPCVAAQREAGPLKSIPSLWVLPLASAFLYRLSMRMRYIYLIESSAGSHRYVGATSYLKRRLDDHNRGKLTPPSPTPLAPITSSTTSNPVPATPSPLDISGELILLRPGPRATTGDESNQR